MGEDKVVFVFVPYVRNRQGSQCLEAVSGSQRRCVMATQKVDLVVHVNETLEEDFRHRIETALQEQQGIVWAHFNDKRPHLMLVEYDPDLTSSYGILQAVRGKNVHAELIGPI